ncbi:LA_2272 family surface repeat-containing protein [Anaeromyxobacter sp. SG64]|uniref:LA_2272 family surface repeat-containing protein n=1 Tax=Anaeromyxobacter sp. SG64 TaxID=2925409 RepID=UPI001F5817B8|nr:hypothetical protein [Anaeromyxobacter sp. SG64]
MRNPLRTTLAALAAAVPALALAGAAVPEPPAAALTALRVVPVDLSLVPPLSLNGEGRVENHLSIGVVARSTVLRGLALAPVHLADEDVSGAQVTWAAASAGGVVRGVQLATVTTVARDLRGLQASQIVNVVRGGAEGVQLGGAANVARRLDGLQAAAVNVAGGVRGVQLAVVNVGGEVSGTQLGLVNVARRVRGAQVGLVNLAEEAEGSVGVLALVRNGRHEVELYATELTPLAAGVRLGGRRAYGVLGAGVQPDPQERSGKTLSTLGGGAGVGFEPAQRLALDLDLVAQAVSLDGTPEAVLGVLRAVAAYRLTEWMGVLAGPTANVLVSDEDQPDLHLGWKLGGRHARVWVGFVAGVRI